MQPVADAIEEQAVLRLLARIRQHARQVLPQEDGIIFARFDGLDALLSEHAEKHEALHTHEWNSMSDGRPMVYLKSVYLAGSHRRASVSSGE